MHHSAEKDFATFSFSNLYNQNILANKNRITAKNNNFLIVPGQEKEQDSDEFVNREITMKDIFPKIN